MSIRCHLRSPPTLEDLCQTTLTLRDLTPKLNNERDLHLTGGCPRDQSSSITSDPNSPRSSLCHGVGIRGVVRCPSTRQSCGSQHMYMPVSYTHLRAHETGRNLVCRLLLEK